MKKILLMVTLVLAFSFFLNGALYFIITEKDSEIGSREQQIETITNDFESLNSTFQEYKNNHSHTNTEYDELMNSYEQLTQTYENYVANHTFSNSEYTTLQNQGSDLQNQLDDLDQNYQDLIEDYDDLLSDYQLITAPATIFDTVNDFEIELNLDKRIYSYTDSISGNVSIYYTNGTPFQGQFNLHIDFLDGTGGMSIGERHQVNGHGDFVVQPPESFFYGPGNYSISIMQILTPEGYVIAQWEDLNTISIEIVAK